MNPPAIHLTIDRLVLDGFDGVDAAWKARFLEGLRDALRGHLTAGLAFDGSACGTLRAVAPAPVAADDPLCLGHAIAAALNDTLRTHAGAASGAGEGA